MSDTHIDASGLATYVRIILGGKLWFIGRADEPEDSLVFEDYDTLDWHVVILNQDDEL